MTTTTNGGDRVDGDGTRATAARRFCPIPAMSMKKAMMRSSSTWCGVEGRPMATGSTAAQRRLHVVCVESDEKERVRGNGD